jgi:hypothetical protein
MVLRFWLAYDGDLQNLTQAQVNFVQWGFARFIPDTTQETARIGRLDEPMALIALAQWLNAGFAGQTLHQMLSHKIRVGHHHAFGENALENYLAFCFAGLFSDPSRSRRLRDIFTFAKKPPSWANQTATLVSLYRDPVTGKIEESEVNWASRPSYSLGTRSFGKRTNTSEPNYASVAHDSDADGPPLAADESKKAVETTFNWLKYADRTPICFPSTIMGPDLLFVLRLEDGHRIWVAVQSKFETSDLLKASKLTSAVATLTPVNFFKVRRIYVYVLNSTSTEPMTVEQQKAEQGSSRAS